MEDPVVEHKRIFVRQSYKTIFAQLSIIIRERFDKESGCNVIVTGSPGIGKSRFYLHCIHQLTSIDEFKDAVLILNFNDEYLQYCRTSRAFYELTRDEVDDAVRTVKLIRLIESSSGKMYAWHGVSILFASPSTPRLKKFGKSAYEFIMPPWSLTELAEYNGLVRD